METPGHLEAIYTADLCDDHIDQLYVCQPIFRDFGGCPVFHGPVVTIKTFEDNTLVRKTLETKGEGRVLVVDGGGSTHCALMGDNLGDLAVANGWVGLIINGCVRDSKALAKLELGVKALASVPRKSLKQGRGEKNVPVSIGGVWVEPGCFVYADHDGVVFAPKRIR